MSGASWRLGGRVLLCASVVEVSYLDRVEEHVTTLPILPMTVPRLHTQPSCWWAPLLLWFRRSNTVISIKFIFADVRYSKEL